MKLKTIYICENCQLQSSKWIGQCPSCNNWNTFIEDVINVGKKDESNMIEVKARTALQLMPSETHKERIKTNISEFDNVIGGGFVIGSLTLFSGEPGIGKSTLTIQICQKISEQNKKILYISGEESIEQISQRAHRLKINNENLQLINSNNLEEILATIKHHKPDFVVIDSIQVMSSELSPGISGSISQIRHTTERFMQFAKTENLTILLIGHVTKDGTLAGPKALEHLVDTVLHLEGDRYHEFRILRSVKNRFGSTLEVGIFEMQETGLIEVKNPSSKFLESRQKAAIGSCLACTLEGNKAFIIEVQALTNISTFGFPKRTASGFDVNRLNLLIAVLEKHASINLANQDVYINIVGGLKIKDPAIDLAICLAIISSFKKQALAEDLVAIGEIGLCGEIRKVNQMERREKEIQKTGLKITDNKKIIKEITNSLF